MPYAKFSKEKTPISVKPWKGLGPGIVEILENFDGDAYRAVCAVKYDEVVYALHCFQKKSKKGIETPPRDKNIVAQRLKFAETHYKLNYKKAR